MCSGCGSAELDKLRAEIAQLRDENQSYGAKSASLESENVTLKAELASAKQELAKIEEIKKGYEEARIKLKESLSQLGPLLGNAGSGSLLPEFEDLKNSDWVSQFAPSGELPANLKALEGELKGLLGDQGILLDGPPKKKTKP
jgi:hypothetical protein